MGLSVYDGDNNENKVDFQQAFLDIQNLKFGKITEKLCYCEFATSKRHLNNQDKFYVTFTLRDIKGKRIKGRMFNISDIGEMYIKIKEIQKKILVVTFKQEYFQYDGKYLNVEKFDIFKSEISSQIYDKFMLKDIEGLDKLKQEFEKTVEVLCSKYNITTYSEILGLIQTRRIFDNDYDTKIEYGLTGYKYKYLSMFNSIIREYYSVSKSYRIILANIIVETLISSNRTAGEVLVELNYLEQLVQKNSETEMISVYKIVKSTIYKRYNLELEIYEVNSILLNKIKDLIYDVYNTKEIMESNVGIFEYKGDIYEGV